MKELLPLFCVASRRRVPENASSVITFLFPYYIGDFPHNIARYAFSLDYHTIAGTVLERLISDLQALYPGYQFVGFVDASPLDEVKAAHLSGLGVIGKNGQLINSKYGSYVFIATIVTDMELEKSQPQKGACLGCGACLRACPTGALEDGRLEKALCRSHITQKKGALTQNEEIEIRLGGLAWGCDCCTDCCPHNHNPIKTPIKAFYNRIGTILTEENTGEYTKEKALGYRGQAVLLRNLLLIGDEK